MYILVKDYWALYAIMLLMLRRAGLTCRCSESRLAKQMI